MIRYPRKNIAQRLSDRTAEQEKKKKQEKPETPAPVTPAPVEVTSNDLTAKPDQVPINIPNVPVIPEPAPLPKVVKYEDVLEEEEITCTGRFGGKLYPLKLWQLHHDLDLVTYHRDELTLEELDKIQSRLPGSMLVAESTADRMLRKFVETSVNNVGPEKYAQVLKAAMGPNAQILLALRCFIAASTNERPRDRITIYRNKSMNSSDFFPKDCQRKWFNPETKREETYYVDRPEDQDNAYWRSSNHLSKQHQVVYKLLEPPPGKQDQLPSDFRDHMKFLLEEYGLEVNTVEEAWRFLDSIGRDSEIEDRILARIAYLITNAQVQRKIYRLGH